MSGLIERIKDLYKAETRRAKRTAFENAKIVAGEVFAVISGLERDKSVLEERRAAAERSYADAIRERDLFMAMANEFRGRLVNPDPVPMLLWCPECGERHVDAGEFEKKPHHTHACQSCGMVWRPAKVATVGVAFLPGCKNEENAA